MTSVPPPANDPLAPDRDAPATDGSDLDRDWLASRAMSIHDLSRPDAEDWVARRGPREACRQLDVAVADGALRGDQ